MKHFFTLTFIIIVLGSPFLAYGQIEKGNKYLWGSLTVPEHYFNSDIPVLELNSGIAYTHFVAKGFALHSTANFVLNRSSPSLKYTQSSVQLLARKYVSVGTKLFVFGGAGLFLNENVYYRFNDLDDKINESQHKNTQGQLMFEVGAMYPLSRRICLIAKTASVGFPLSMSGLSFGFTYSLRPLSIKDTATQYLAQTQRGNWMVSGSFSRNTENQYKYSSYLLSSDNSTETQDISYDSYGIGLGCFIATNKLLGFDLSVDYQAVQETSHTSADQYSSETVRKYMYMYHDFLPYFKQFYGKGRLKLYTRVTANISFYKSKLFYDSSTHSYYDSSTHSNNDSDEAFYYGGGLDYGLSYFLRKHFILESQLGRFYINKTKEQPRQMGWDLFRYSPYITLNYVFLKAKSK